jgi:hypothetical protein
MASPAFGQSQAAGGTDLATALANAAGAVGVSYFQSEAIKNGGKGLAGNSGTILAVVGIGAAVLIGGIVVLAVVLKR